MRTAPSLGAARELRGESGKSTEITRSMTAWTGSSIASTGSQDRVNTVVDRVHRIADRVNRGLDRAHRVERPHPRDRGPRRLAARRSVVAHRPGCGPPRCGAMAAGVEVT